MNRLRQAFFFLSTCLFLVSARAVEPSTSDAATNLLELRSGEPLLVGTKDRRGPLALSTLQSWPKGSAYVFDSAQPDLFVQGRGGSHSGLYLFPWKETLEDGLPLFKKPILIKSPYAASGTIFQTEDKVIHGVWIDKFELVHTTFDRASLAFSEEERLKITGLPARPRSLAIRINPDQSVEVVLEISDGIRLLPPEPPKPRTENYQPYDGAGIWRGKLPYVGLYAVSLPRLLSGPTSKPRLVSSSLHEVIIAMHQLTEVNLGPDHEHDFVTGSRFGGFSYYHNTANEGLSLEPRRDIVDSRSNAIRHPTISPGVVAYPNPETGLSDLIAGGEGALYFYQFTGSQTSQGKPKYKDAVVVLQENAELYTGSLPVISVVDLNADGALDIVSGNSEGRILFFQNLGTNDFPAFKPGIPLQAGGHEIHIQPGYNHDIQGPQEACWGYTCPTVVDWNEDGLLDILMGDSTNHHTVFLNRGTSTAPKFEPSHSLYCDGLELHGMWRVQPAVGILDDHMVYILVDGEDHLHLYHRADDYNVVDRGKLLLEDSTPIGTSYLPAGGTGRCKLKLSDWDRDGLVDLIIGTSRSNAIPNRQSGYPRPALDPKSLSNVLWLKNVGSNAKPIFRFPILLKHHGATIEPGGVHACSPEVTVLGGGAKQNLLVGSETGRFIFYRREKIKP
jgi:hypothetical protein